MKKHTTKVLTLLVVLTLMMGLMSFGILSASAEGAGTLVFDLQNYTNGNFISDLALVKGFSSDEIAEPTVLGVYETVEDARNDTNASSGYLYIHQAYYIAVRLSAESGKTYDFSTLTASSISVKLEEEALAVIEVTLGGDDARIIIELPELHYFEWNTDDDNEHWMECSCGEKTEAAAHEYSETYQTDMYTHWRECECGKRIDENSHSGSDYDCDDDYHWIPCDTCGYRIDESIHIEDGSGWHTEDETYHWQNCYCGYQMHKAEHGYSGWQYEEDEHYKYCMECNREINRDAHNYQPGYDSDQHYTRCTECEYDEPDTYPEFHTLSWVTDGEKHWKECADCEYESAHVKHNFQYYYDVYGIGDTHWTECECGETTEEEAHDFGDYITDGYAHHRECACGKTADEGACSGSGEFQSNGDEHWRLCDECSAKIEIGTHMEDGYAHHDESNHWLVCVTCYAKYHVEAHSFSEWRNDTSSDEHYKECVACGYEIGRAAHEYVLAYDKNSHWQECSCGEIQNDESHDDSDADGKCDVCFFGDYDITATDALVTVGGVEVTKVEERTTVTIVAIEKPGYIFTGWVITGATVVDASAQTTTFVMPHGDVTVVATYKKLYTTTVQSGTATPDSAIAGTTVTIVANTPAANMVFDKWVVISGSVTLADENNSTTTFTLPDGDVEVKATYKKLYTTTVQSGTATPDSAIAGMTVTIKADDPAANMVFDKWVVISGSVTLADENDSTTTFTLPEGNVEVQATYKKLYTTTVQSGTATPDSAIAGTTVTIVADAPAANMVFDKWVVISGSVTLADENNFTTTFTLPEGNVEVKATYKLKGYTVTLPGATTGYEVSAQAGSVSPVEDGGDYSFTIAFATGYKAGASFAVKANGVVLTPVDGVYTIQNITENQTVTVEGVEKISYSITTTYATATISGSPVSSATVTDTVTIVAEVRNGYRFVGWVVTGATVDDATASTTTIVANGLGDISVTASYELATYDITITLGTATVDDVPVTQATINDVITITAQSQVGKVFKAWVVSGGTVDQVSSATTTFIADGTGPITIEATYVYASLPIVITNGTAKIGEDVVDRATIIETVTIIAAEKAGMTFDAWVVSGATVADASASTTTFVADGSGDIRIEATYVYTLYNVTVTGGVAKVDSATVTQATMQNKVTIVANTVAGKVFCEWQVTGGTVVLEDAEAATTTFQMTAGDVTIVAVYEDAVYTVGATAATVTKESVAVTEAKMGDVLTITAIVPAGTTFKEWVVVGGTVASATDATTTFTVDGTGNITIRATFNSIPYNVTITGDKGTIWVNGHQDETTAGFGDVVRMYADEPSSGYYFAGWNVIKGNVVLADATQRSIEFEMVAEEVELEPIYKEREHLDEVHFTFEIPGEGDKAVINLVSDEPEKYYFTNAEITMHRNVGGSLTLTPEDTILAGRYYYLVFTVQKASNAYILDASTKVFINGEQVDVNMYRASLQFQYPNTITVTNGTAYDSNIRNNEITEANLAEWVYISAGEAPEGKVFSHWVVVSGGVTLTNSNVAETNFKMGEEPVVIEAVYDTILTEVNLSIVTPQVGQNAPTVITSSDPEKYTATIGFFYSYDSGYPHMGPSDVFLAGTQYAMRFEIAVAEGYALSDDTVVTVNGKTCGRYGSNAQREWDFQFPVVLTLTNGKAYTTSARTEEIDYNNFFNGTIYLSADPAPEGKAFLMWRIIRDGTDVSYEYSKQTSYSISTWYKEYSFEAIYATPLEKVDVKVPVPTPGTTTITSITSPSPNFNILIESWTYLDEHSVKQTMGAEDTYQIGVVYTCNYRLVPAEGYCLEVYNDVTINGQAINFNSRTNGTATRHGFITWYSMIPVALNVTGGKVMVGGVETDVRSFLPGTVVTIVPDESLYPDGKTLCYWQIDGGSYLIDYATSKVENFTVTIKNIGTTGGEVVIRATYSEPFGLGSANTGVAHPAVGEAIVYSNKDVASSSYYSAELLGWYEGETLLEAGHVFEAGKIYTARIRITPYASYYFTENLEVDDLYNSFSGVGIDANAILERGENGEYLIYTVSIKAKIRQENISVNVTAPVAGMAPSTEVTPEAGTECPATFDHWEVYDESKSRFVKMGEDELFVVGRRYRVYIGFTSTSTHFLDLKNTVAYINGIKATSYSSGSTTVEDEQLATRGWYVEFTVEAGGETFDITVDDGSALVEETPVTQVGGGVLVTITANAPATGKAFKEWQIISGDGVVLASITDATTTFVMPAGDVRIKAVYRNTPHNVTVEGGSADVTFVGSGETVTITADEAPSGKYFAGWESSTGTVIFADANAKTTTFAMVDSDVTITAIFADKTVLEEINFTVTAPANGNNPSYVINSAEADKYTAVVDKWRLSSVDMTPEDTFAWGQSYYFIFTMTLDEKYTFDGNTVINVNGKITHHYANGGLQRYLYLEAPVSITVENGYAVTTDDIDGEHLTETTYGDSVYLFVGELAANQYFVRWELVSGNATIHNSGTANGAYFTVPKEPVVIRANIHTHTYDSNYTSDKNNHWFACTDPDCPGKSHSIKDKAAHVPGPAATYESAQTCTVCGYEIAAKLQAKTVTVSGGKAQVNGVDIANGTPVLPGTVVTIIADEPEVNMYFTRWGSNGGITLNNNQSATTTFVMGTNNVTVTAYYATYSIIGAETFYPEFTVPIAGLTVGNASVEDNSSRWTATVIGYYDGVTKLNPTDVFVQGRTYTVDVRLTPDLGYLFDADATFEVEHDIYGTEAIIQSVSDTEILCRFTFVAKTLITSLNVNFQPPFSGNAASFVVTVPDDAPYTVHPVVYWYDVDDEYGYEANGAQKLVFELCKNYAINFYLIPKEGYIFVDGVEYDPETSKIPEGNVVYGDMSVSGEGMSIFVVYNCAPNPIGATVTIEGGSAWVYDGEEGIPVTTGSYPIGTRIWLEANEPEEGKTFLYWEVVSGNAVIDYPSYPWDVSFLLSEDVVIRAVYTDDVAHSITVTGGTASAATAKFGETIGLMAGEAPEGKYFYKWVVKSGGVYIHDIYELETGFTMTGSDVEIEAIFLAPIKDIVLNVNGELPTVGGSGNYTITVESVNGNTELTDLVGIWWEWGFTLDSTLETEPEWLGSYGVVFEEGYYVIVFETWSDHFFFDEELTLTLKFTDGTVIGMCMSHEETWTYFIALFDLSTPAHTHNYGTLFEETPATHTSTELAAGMKAHYYCKECKCYFDANKNLVEREDLIIPAPTHTYGEWIKDDDNHWKTCTCGKKDQEAEHNYDDGSDMICNACGYDRTVPHTHGEGEKVNGQSATCTVNGWKDYYKCSCGKLYTEAACTNEITNLEEWKAGAGKLAASHSHGDLIPKTDANCSETGMQAHYECSVCHTLFDENKNVKTTAELTIATNDDHSFGTWTSNGNGTHSRTCSRNANHKETDDCAGGNATCTEKAICSTCNTAYGNYGEHDYGTLINEVPAKHTAEELLAGMKAHYYCEECESYFDESKNPVEEEDLIIPAPTHTYGEWIKDDENHWKTCACGKKDQEAEHAYDDASDMICNVCEYDRTVPHTHGEGEKVNGQSATCTVNGWKDYYRCSCGKLYTEAACTNEITNLEEWKAGAGKLAASHSHGDLIPKTDANCSETGMQAHYECSVCHTLFDENKNVKTAAELTIATNDDHSFGTWTSNGNGTHSRTCSRNANHKETDDCAGGNATCTEKAICSTCSSAYGTTLAHNHSSEWSTTETKHWHECSCGDKKDEAEHTPGAAATETEPQICTTCGYVIEPATGHVTHTPSTEWSKDETHHWHICIGCDGQILDRSAHTDGDQNGACDVCAYAMNHGNEGDTTVDEIKNEQMGVTVTLPNGSNATLLAGTVLGVVELPTSELSEDTLSAINVHLNATANVLAYYDLTLTLDGGKVQPNGKLVVTLPAITGEYDRIKVVYVAEDGSFEECTTTVNADGSISFETDHFSKYAVIGVNDTNEGGGSSAGIVIIIVIGVILILGIGGFAIFWFVIKKKTFADLFPKKNAEVNSAVIEEASEKNGEDQV